MPFVKLNIILGLIIDRSKYQFVIFEIKILSTR